MKCQSMKIAHKCFLNENGIQRFLVEDSPCTLDMKKR